jgi:hypothetical protein
MVVDGKAEFVGSDAHRAQEEVGRAGVRSKARVALTAATTGVDVTVEGSPRSADIYLVIADDQATTQVGAGENKGRSMHHVAIARSLRKIGSTPKGGSFHKLVELTAEPRKQRMVVFVQNSGPGEVFGAAVLDPK